MKKLQKFKQNKLLFIVEILFIIGFFLLPYYLFNGKLFIGGDDSRLFYIYPWDWLNKIALYSWFHLSAVGSNNPNQFIIPFLTVWSLLSILLNSKVMLDYLSFSLPLILGFIFFQKLMGEFLYHENENYQLIRFVGALIYTLSPIIVYNQLSVFLYSAWLIGLLPIICYYFFKYLKSGNFSYVFINTLWCILLSFAIYTIPWMLGFFLPIAFSLLVLIPIFSKSEIIIFLKRSFVFFSIFILSQAFWIYSFVINILIPEKNSFLGVALSKNSTDTFSETVLSTASGNIFYPMLNLFHRQMTVDYKTPLENIFFAFYDKTILIDAIYVVIIFIAILLFRNILLANERKFYLFFFVAFIFSLFFFTVNIGPLKYIFLFMGHIPGFIMFRNFYDKFALGYALLFSIVVTLSIIVITRKFEKVKIILPFLVLFVVLFNNIPIKAVINRPLWTTKNIFTVATIPNEYFLFTQQVRNTLPQTANILSLPFNIAGYTIIKDEDSNNVYAGRSLVELFTGVNDFSGNLSFPQVMTNTLITDIKERNYNALNDFLRIHNIGYIFVTNNIPQQVKRSYLFDKKVLPYQDKKFLDAIAGAKILSSTKGNYVLYRTKYPTSVLNSNHLTFQQINPVTYRLYFKNVKISQKLDFLDAFSKGWKIYPEVYTSPSTNKFAYLTRKDVFEASHIVLNGYGNQWTINPAILMRKFPLQYYHTNSDGSIDMIMTLYFKPQDNFYIGTFISIVTVSFCFAFFIYRRIIKYDKKN